MNRQSIAYASAMAATVMALTGCLIPGDPSEAESSAADQAAEQTLPPLDEPSSTESLQHDESDQSEQGEADAGSSQDATSATSVASDVLDVSEFSAESQQSAGFPEMLAEFPDDADRLVLQEVRTGRHEGYDRIVFDHAGQGAPAWYAEYVQEAVEPGSGFSLGMESDAKLYISAVGLVPSNAGEQQGHLEISEGWSDTHGTVFNDVITTFVHHGTASYYIGLDAEREFRVSVWQHPDGPRLIVDVLR